MRIVVILASLGLLGGAGWGAWTGYGAVSAPARAGVTAAGASIRTGSAGLRGPGSTRIK